MLLLLFAACEPFGPIQLSPDPVDVVTEPGVISADRSHLDFGERSVLLDGPQELSVRLENDGEQARAASLVWLVDDPAFSHDAPAIIELGPGESLDLTLRYAPETEGTHSAALAWRDGTLSLEGNATAPVARLLPTQEHLGAVAVGCDATTSLALLNDGSEALEIDAITLDEGLGFSLHHPSVDTLGPGQQLTLDLEFSPLSGGERGTTIRVESNDPLHPSTGVTVQGLGVAGAALQEQHDYLPGSRVDLLFVVDSGPTNQNTLLLAQPWTQSLFDAFNAGNVDWQVSVANGEADCHSTYAPYLSAAGWPADAAGLALAYGLNPAGGGTRQLLDLANATLERSDPGECLDGFLRADAHLHVVVISADGESSEGNASQWYSALSAHAASGELMVSSVAGRTPSCETPEVLEELASASGGVNLDACLQDWDTFFQALAQLSAARSQQEQRIVLAREPVPETLEVYAGSRRLSAWTWDDHQQVLIVDGLSAGLDIGDELRVEYTEAQDCE